MIYRSCWSITIDQMIYRSYWSDDLLIILIDGTIYRSYWSIGWSIDHIDRSDDLTILLIDHDRSDYLMILLIGHDRSDYLSILLIYHNWWDDLSILLIDRMAYRSDDLTILLIDHDRLDYLSILLIYHDQSDRIDTITIDRKGSILSRSIGWSIDPIDRLDDLSILVDNLIDRDKTIGSIDYLINHSALISLIECPINPNKY
jgi:hypothetical protein